MVLRAAHAAVVWCSEVVRVTPSADSLRSCQQVEVQHRLNLLDAALNLLDAAAMHDTTLDDGHASEDLSPDSRRSVTSLLIREC